MRGVLTDDAIRAMRRVIWEQHGYQWYEDEVERFHDSTAAIKIASSPARTAKSYSGAYDVLPDIIIHGLAFGLSKSGALKGDWVPETLRGWIVCPNYDLAKEFDYLWKELVEKHDRTGHPYQIRRAKKNPQQGDMEIVLFWGKNQRGEDVESVIEVRTSANERSLQSEELDWTILSEAAELDESVWTQYMSTRATRAILPTTPKVHAHWILEMIEKSEENPELGVEAFSFTVRANPEYKCERFWRAHAKAELTVAGELLTMPEDEDKPPSPDNGHDCFDPTVDCDAAKDDDFAEQFLGRWTLKEGRVVPLRDKVGPQGQPSHVIDYDPGWLRHASLHTSIDYGFDDGCCVGFWMVGANQVVLRRSIYERNLTPEEVADRYFTELAWFEIEYDRDRDELLRRFVGDPKRPEVAKTFRNRGLRIFDVDKQAQVDRLAGHMEFMSLLKTDPATGQPGMLIHADNKEILAEWKKLRRNPKARVEDSATAFLGADHGYDMTRYFVQTKPVRVSIPGRTEESPFTKYRKAAAEANRRRRLATVQSAYGTARVGASL